MKWNSFHHPDWCATVIRRHLSDELIDMLMEAVMVMTYRERCAWQTGYPVSSSYRSAVSRLQKAGLVAKRRTDGETPLLTLVEAAESRVSPCCRRRPPWPRVWDNRWYLLSYDVPETKRPYRDMLRGFLKRKKMGCLHRSVWITPLDIRPEFDDLAKTGGVDEFAFLFESKTVLGRSCQDVVRTAWNMDSLREMQKGYLKVFQENLARAEAGPRSAADLRSLTREEYIAYVSVMEPDPFLPRPLWPSDYLGDSAWTFHRKFIRRLSELRVKT